MLHEVKDFLLQAGTDNTEALNMIVLNYETLTSSFGIDEEDLDDHLEVKIILIQFQGIYGFGIYGYGTVFHALSHGVIHFVRSVSFKNLEVEVSDWLFKNFNQ